MILVEDIKKAQDRWAAGVVAIGAAWQSKEDYVQVATDFINDVYAYDVGEVLFKPTMANHRPFRPSFTAALSYFVAQNIDYPEDQGFALKPWVKVEFFERNYIVLEGSALSMGKYLFTAADGEEALVLFSFSYVADSSGNLKIVLHHSSLPYGK